MKKNNIFEDKIVFQYANFRHDISIKWLNEPSMPTDTNLFPIWIIEIALTWLKNFSCIQQMEFPRNTNAQPEVCVCVCFFFVWFLHIKTIFSSVLHCMGVCKRVIDHCQSSTGTKLKLNFSSVRILSFQTDRKYQKFSLIKHFSIGFKLAPHENRTQKKTKRQKHTISSG